METYACTYLLIMLMCLQVVNKCCMFFGIVVLSTGCHLCEVITFECQHNGMDCKDVDVLLRKFINVCRYCHDVGYFSINM